MLTMTVMSHDIKVVPFYVNNILDECLTDKQLVYLLPHIMLTALAWKMILINSVSK